MGTGGPFPGGKARPGRDTDHSPPSSVEVVNEWELYLLSPWYLHGAAGQLLKLLSLQCKYCQAAGSANPHKALSMSLECLWGNREKDVMKWLSRFQLKPEKQVGYCQEYRLDLMAGCPSTISAISWPQWRIRISGEEGSVAASCPKMRVVSNTPTYQIVDILLFMCDVYNHQIWVMCIADSLYHVLHENGCNK